MLVTSPIDRSAHPGPWPATRSVPPRTPAAAPGAAGTATGKVSGRGDVRGPSFQQVLEAAMAEVGGLRLSGHARARLAQQGIRLDPAQQERVAAAVARAQAKGAREAVIMLDGLALVASIKNRTLITVVEGSRLKENVFTQIDSVVFA